MEKCKATPGKCEFLNGGSQGRKEGGPKQDFLKNISTWLPEVWVLFFVFFFFFAKAKIGENYNQNANTY